MLPNYHTHMSTHTNVITGHIQENPCYNIGKYPYETLWRASDFRLSPPLVTLSFLGGRYKTRGKSTRADHYRQELVSPIYLQAREIYLQYVVYRSCTVATSSLYQKNILVPNAVYRPM